MLMCQAIEAYKVYQVIKDTTMPIRTAYKIAKIGSYLQSNVDFYLQKYDEIISKYCKRDENGRPIISEDGSTIQLQEGVSENYKTDMNELEQLTIDSPAQYLTFEDLDGWGTITPKEINALLPFMSE